MGYVIAVGDFVAGLGGAALGVPAGPMASLVLLAFGGLFLALWIGRWRLLGLVPMAVALLLWAGHSRPDILIADNGRIFGVLTDAGRILSSGEGNGYAAESWLEDDGDLASQAEAHARGRLERRRNRIEAEVPGLGKLLYVGTRDAATAGPDCAAAAIVIAPNWRGGPGGPCLFVGRRPPAPRRRPRHRPASRRPPRPRRPRREPRPPVDAAAGGARLPPRGRVRRAPYRGMRRVALSPPSSALSPSSSEPPWLRATSSAIDRPRPTLPAGLERRAASSRVKGWSARARSASGIPGPSSSTTKVSARAPKRTVRSTLRPCSAALPTRFCTARATAPGRSGTRPAWTAPRSLSSTATTRIAAPPRRASSAIASARAKGSVGDRLLEAVAAGEGEELAEHPLHLVDVRREVAGLLAVVHQRQRQLHAGERRPEVVADARQHLGALLDLALQPRAHRQERRPRPPHLLGAGRAEGKRAALAEGLGRLGEGADRADLVAQEDDRDRGQEQRGEDHQHEELVRVRHRQPVARHRRLEDAGVGADADRRRARVADRGRCGAAGRRRRGRGWRPPWRR